MNSLKLINDQVLLASRPRAEPVANNFRLVQCAVPELQEGQVLVRNQYLSLDPYMRGRMNDSKSYAQPQALNEVMGGRTVGEVIASRNPAFIVGEKVFGNGGWQLFHIIDSRQISSLTKLDKPGVALSAHLGPAGMPGVTAWYGLCDIISPKFGQTVTVSAASGAVGSVVGQLAKERGLRVVGFAGGPEKCAYVVDELGFDACIDYKQHRDLASLTEALARECPKGIDGHFENVGGVILDAVLQLANPFSRVAMCGTIAGYNGDPIPLQNPQLLVRNRMRMEGFIISEHMERWPVAQAELCDLIVSGKLKYRESIAQGLASAPQAFIGMLQGRNFGKQLVDLT